jgi:hypothetical protein
MNGFLWLGTMCQTSSPACFPSDFFTKFTSLSDSCPRCAKLQLAAARKPIKQRIRVREVRGRTIEKIEDRVRIGIH